MWTAAEPKNESINVRNVKRHEHQQDTGGCLRNGDNETSIT